MAVTGSPFPVPEALIRDLLGAHQMRFLVGEAGRAVGGVVGEATGGEVGGEVGEAVGRAVGRANSRVLLGLRDSERLPVL